MPHIPPPLPTRDAKMIEHRFWDKVKKGAEDECWPWQGSTTRGYGTIFAWGRPQYSHRFAYALVRGDIPLGGHVLHECDNPICNNPKHLFLGDQASNMADRARKGRGNQRSGEAHPFAKITAETALAIYNAKGMFVDIAKQFNVSVALVSQIKLGKTWVAVTGGEPQPRYHKRNVA